MEEEKAIEQQVLNRTIEEARKATLLQHESDPCVICLESVSERTIALPCKHESFDFLCLVSWLQERSTCPLCKRNVCSVRYRSHSTEPYKIYQVPDVKTESLGAATARTSRTSSNFHGRGRGRHQTASGRPRETPRGYGPLNPDAALLRRKNVYRNQLYSSHVGSNRLSKYKDLTPQIIARDEALLSRARKWIRRELKVFDFLDIHTTQEAGMAKRANNAEFLMEYIVAILKTVDIKGAGGQAEDMLQEYLGRDNTRLFLHELRAWLRSPYSSLDDWDRHVQYGVPTNVLLESVKCSEELQANNSPTLASQTVGRSYNRNRGPIADRYSPYHCRGH